MITLRSFTICFVFGFSMICENIVFAQNISSNWKSVVDSVNTYYKNANFEKKIAVEYLLNNIPYHTSKYDQKLSSYYNKLKFINKTYTYPMCCQHYEELYNTLPQMESSYISDMNVITAKYIIDNIEKAFVTWKNLIIVSIYPFKIFVSIFFHIRLVTKILKVGVISCTKSMQARLIG